MVGKITVVSGQEFDEWLQGHQLAPGHRATRWTARWRDEGRATVPETPVHQLPHGERVAGTPALPMLEGLYGSRVPLEGGGAEIADDAYILESILNPRAKVVEGWKPIMPGHYERPGDGRRPERRWSRTSAA